MSSLKILVCCHKATPRIQDDDVFAPILLGSQFASDKLKEEFRDDYWDCKGKNIGRLHPYCAELTAIYWAWKHYAELGDPDYIGLFHYRRFLNFGESIPEIDLWKCAFFDFSLRTRRRFGWDEQIILKYCQGSDIVLPCREKILDPYDWKTPTTLETHYKHSHYPEDFDITRDYIKTNIPEYAQAAMETAQSMQGYFCNMFIMTREMFFDYAQWLFDIILPLVKLLPVTGKKYDDPVQCRVLGFLGERLFNVWINKQRTDGIKIRETQRLTGYLGEMDRLHYIRQYGFLDYRRARREARRTDCAHRTTEDMDDEASHPIEEYNDCPAVSIVLPVYHVKQYLRSCMDSLVNQTLHNIEIICVNNGDDDGCADILLEYSQCDSRVRVITLAENIGMPQARNVGMDAAGGKYLAFVDSDDICDVTMFEKLYRKAEELSADIVTCGVWGFTDDDLTHRYLHRPLTWYDRSNEALPLKERSEQLLEPAGWCKLFRTSYIRGLAGFRFRANVLAWEDVPAMTKAFLRTDRIATVQEALYFYRQRTSGNLSNNMTQRHIEEFISGALMQQDILEENSTADEKILARVEEFKFLYAEWMLTRLPKRDWLYYFTHVPALFGEESARLLEPVFALYPGRRRFYQMLMCRSALLYTVLRAIWLGKKVGKKALKKLFGVRREDIYWTFRIGPWRVRLFRRSYYADTRTWFSQQMAEADRNVEWYCRQADEILLRSEEIEDQRDAVQSELMQVQADNQQISQDFERTQAELQKAHTQLATFMQQQKQDQEYIAALKQKYTSQMKTIAEKDATLGRYMVLLRESKADIKSAPKVSVIIPVYKREQYLSQCFDSVLTQTMQDIEIIIVDKGEQDEARDIIDHYVTRDQRIRAPHIPNNGYGASCNIGLALARSPYVLIVESDDYILPDMCESLYSAAEKYRADIVKTPYIAFMEGGVLDDCPYRQKMAMLLPKDRCFSAKEYGEILEIHASVWSCLYRRSYLEERNIQFVEADGAGYVDVGFRIDTLTQTDRIVWIDTPYYYYRVDSAGSSTNVWELPVMIQRWREAHEKLLTRQADYDQYYGRHLIVDEYLNTVYRGGLQGANTEERLAIAENLQFVKDCVIAESDLTDMQKQELMEWKHNHSKMGNQERSQV